MDETVKTGKAVKVMKFGGTCLFPGLNRAQVIQRIAADKEAGHPVVAVVSAMGRAGDPYATDTLEALLPATPAPDPRERDALLCCGEGISATLVAAELCAAGVPALSLWGAQLGLRTGTGHGNAEIESMDPSNILDCLDRELVVVAGGFHGVNPAGSLSTLGRGGSDTAAVAIAAALDAERVIFFKDVDGLFSADPRRVPEASPLPMIPHDEAAHLGRSGARVLHPRSASLAERHGIAIEIRNLTAPHTGTLVTSRHEIRKMKPAAREIFAVNCLEGITQFRVEPERTPSFPDFPQRLFQALARAGISLDMFSILEETALFTVASRDGARTMEIAREAGCRYTIREECAKVSLLGGGIHGVPGIMSRIVTALAEVNIPIFQSVDTYTVISVLVAGEKSTRCAKALHKAFL